MWIYLQGTSKYIVEVKYQEVLPKLFLVSIVLIN